MKATAFASFALLLVVALGATLWLARSPLTSTPSAAPQSTSPVHSDGASDRALSSPPETPNTALVRRIVEERVVATPSLELVPPPGIRVRVVNLSGAPLPAIPVGAIAAEKGWRSGGLVFTATTDSEGYATISISDPVQRQGRWIVRPLACMNRRVESEVNTEEMPSHPLLLVMPDTGEVEVQLLRSDRTPYDGEAEVTLFHGSTKGSANVVETARCTDGTGRVRWPLVQVGMSLRVRASAPSSVWSHRIAGSGPRRLGEKVTLYVVVDPDSPTLTARVVDDSGNPIAERKLYLRSMQAVEGQTIPINKSVRTDLEGVFSLRLEGVFREELHVFILDPSNSPSDSQRGALATIDLRNPTASPPVFALRLPEVLATGTIVDSNNQPIQGASVASATDSDPKSKVIAAHSDDTGHFEVRGWSVARSVELLAWHFRSSEPSEPVEVAIGAAGVRIVMPSR